MGLCILFASSIATLTNTLSDILGLAQQRAKGEVEDEEEDEDFEEEPEEDVEEEEEEEEEEEVRSALEALLRPLRLPWWFCKLPRCWLFQRKHMLTLQEEPKKKRAAPKAKAEKPAKKAKAPAKKESKAKVEKPEKKVKKKKDPNAPKRGMSAFMLFSNDNRAKARLHLHNSSSLLLHQDQLPSYCTTPLYQSFGLLLTAGEGGAARALVWRNGQGFGGKVEEHRAQG